MILVLTVTIPIFVVILAGYIAAKRGIMSKESIKAFTSFVFYFCLPLLLFRNLANAPVAEQLRGDYILAYLLAGLVSFAIGYAVARWIFNCTVAERAVQGLGVSFGHTVFMTIPIGLALYGEASVLPIALLITVEMAVIVPLSIVLLEIQRGERNGLVEISGTAFRAIFFNPIVPSILLGIAAAILQVEIPAVLNGLVNLVQGATIPCALFAIGASLAGLSFSERLGETGFLVVGKLLMYPLLVFVFMSMFPDIPPEWRNIAIIAAATPLGVSVYLVASTYDTYVNQASAATLVSMLFAVVTLSVLVALFSPVG
ncbi:MAG: AEC family transporter [Proteobacteria bacterium]|nr:AEC family transporter [Pseudomonadota bacterium]